MSVVKSTTTPINLAPHQIPVYIVHVPHISTAVCLVEELS